MADNQEKKQETRFDFAQKEAKHDKPYPVKESKSSGTQEKEGS